MPSKKGPEARTLRVVSRQRMIALPTWVVRRLGVAPGAALYFHRHRGGEVVLATKAIRDKGQVGFGGVEDELAAATERAARFERLYLNSLTGAERARSAQIYQQALRVMLPIEERLDALTRDLHALGERLPFARRTRSARGGRARATDVIPTPGASPPSEASDEGDAASGAQRVP
jgi:hypothetical protein